jgi:hypothetical protein
MRLLEPLMPPIARAREKDIVLQMLLLPLRGTASRGYSPEPTCITETSTRRATIISTHRHLVPSHRSTMLRVSRRKLHILRSRRYYADGCKPNFIDHNADIPAHP